MPGKQAAEKGAGSDAASTPSNYLTIRDADMIYDGSGNLGEFREIAQVLNALKQQNRCEEVRITTDK